MASKITERILAQTGMPRLVSALADELSPGDLQSLLLAVYQSRTRAARLTEVAGRQERSALNAPSNVDARLLNAFDRIAFAAAEGFEGVELSPVCPLGTTTLLGGIDQNNLLTTIRNAEVLGDSTPAMALECARRRKPQAQRTAEAAVRLASSQRVVRLQPFDAPGLTPHFRLFALVSAGRDSGSHEFEIQHLSEHVRFYLNLFRGLNREGFAVTSPLVEVSDVAASEALLAEGGVSHDEVREHVRAHRFGGSERFLHQRRISLPADVIDPARELAHLAQGSERLGRIKERVVNRLQEEYPEARFRFNLARLEGLGYYTGLCLRVSPTAPDGARYAIADGGFTDWTARLLADKKERFLTSAIGSELVCRKYRNAV